MAQEWECQFCYAVVPVGSIHSCDATIVEKRYPETTSTPLSLSPANPANRKVNTFRLFRAWDATGVSGTGTVAEGVQFSDGTCALRWLTEHSSTAIYASIADVEYIHGHQGTTRVEWDDPMTR